jgi:hypothetical protein
LSFPDAVLVHLALSAILIAVCAVAWTRWLVGRREPFLVLCCMAAAPLWPPVLYVLGMGQNSVLVLAGLTGCVACLRRGRDAAAGACLALATVKPHLALALVAFAAAWPPGWRRLRLLVGLTAALVVAGALITAARPTIWGDYAAFLGRVTPPTQYHGATLDGWARRHEVAWLARVSWPLWAASVAAAAAVSWFSRGRAEDLPRRAALVACLALAGVPHAFSYDFVLLLPVFLSVVAGLFGRPPGWAWRWALAAAAAAVLAVGKNRAWPETAYWPVPWLVGLAAVGLPRPSAPAPAATPGPPGS